MRYGVLADIHANLAALRAVLAALEREGVDAYLCAGDVVGYGPQPNECVEALARLPVECVAGNHDLMATGRLDDTGAGRIARRTLAWTRTALDPAARAWLEALPERLEVPGATVTHASLMSPSRYVASDAEAALELDRLGAQERPADVLVVGHTHRATVFGARTGRVADGLAATVSLAEGERWLLNPGAVGQSRERGIAAWFAVLDVEHRRADLHAVAYDVGATRAELRRRGLPPSAVHAPPRRASLRRLGRRLT
jgi:predicted phosphodiesterase